MQFNQMFKLAAFVVILIALTVASVSCGGSAEAQTDNDGCEGVEIHNQTKTSLKVTAEAINQNGICQVIIRRN